MCGVVTYFGNAPDPIARIVTGMSAIIYRAPDSTGIGTFGSLSESMIMRKTLGSVSGIIPALLKSPCFKNPDKAVFSLFSETSMTTREMQKRLINYENLSTEIYASLVNGERPYISMHEMVTENCDESERHNISPGYAGRPYPLPEYKLRNIKEFRELISTLALNYNLSSVAIKALMREQLEQNMVIQEQIHGESWKVSGCDIFNAFDYLFQKLYEEFRPQKMVRQSFKRVYINHNARKYLWKILPLCSIKIPDDFDTDGIQFLFRLIDTALVCRISNFPNIAEVLQEMLNQSLPAPGITARYDWNTLYAAEKALNVYGRAAGTAFEWLQRNEWLPALFAGMGGSLSHSVSIPFGSTEPETLGFFSQPVIAHGRWALQSSVTVRNAHPFMDQTGTRLTALNGQFAGDVEDQMKTFLSEVAGFSFRTENSAEYLSLFWAYYFETLKSEKKKFQEIQTQVALELENFGAGNNTINYRLFKQLQGKTEQEIDEMAFIRAVRQFTEKGGQIAAVGISMNSPRTLYAASCNRPLFIVRRVDTDDYMIVSDVNAAMGLFSQLEIADVSRKYELLIEERDKEVATLKVSPLLKKELDGIMDRYNMRIDEVLARFRVEMHALDGGEIFAKIFTDFNNKIPCRRVKISDFQGNLLHDLEPETFNLTPPHVHKDLNKSFFESHLEEVPGLMETMIDAVLDQKDALDPIMVNTAVLQRRFGKHLSGMKRIVLTGMGSSYNTCMYAAGFIRQILPGIQVVCLKPVDIEILSSVIMPQSDLVLMVSWSGTTADMIVLAKKLHKANAVCVGVTEKIIGDLALITRKSGGIIHAMSGEEVTVSAVKSTFCLLLALDLFILRMKWHLFAGEQEFSITVSIRQIPDILRQMMTDKQMMKAVEALSFSRAGKELLLIADDLHAPATGHEARLKIEEMTWSLKTRVVDYSELPLNLVHKNREGLFVLVNATGRPRIQAAMDVMEKLSQEGIDFVVVTWDSSLKDHIAKRCDTLIVVPKIHDCFQPFIDLFFYYHLAFHFGRARGGIDDDFPRNRAKSVTTSRSVLPPQFSPGSELFNIRHRTGLVVNDSGDMPDPNAPTAWEDFTFDGDAMKIFRQMRKLAECLDHDDPLSMLLEFDMGDLSVFASALFDRHNPKDLFFLPLDLDAKGAIQQAMVRFRRILPCRMRMLQPGESHASIPEESVVMMISSKRDVMVPDQWATCEHLELLWVGFMPDTPQNSFSCGRYIHKFDGAAGNGSFLYAGIVLLLIKAWSLAEPQKAAILTEHFKLSPGVIRSILNNGHLAEDISDVMGRNHQYKSLLFLTTPDGNGIPFVRSFDGIGNKVARWESFGNGAHGSLVTVDNRVASKYVLLEDRGRMHEMYGADVVGKWEHKYLQGMRVDQFLSTLPGDMGERVDKPFFSEGEWYLPLLRPDYEVFQDNLIILDATSEHYLNQAIDDLTVFGCRQARMIVLTQEAFQNMPEKRALHKFPLSGMISLSAMRGHHQPLPISDFHMPFALALLGTAMAGAC